MNSSTTHIVTLDVDWAPDWAIDRTARILAERGVKATWFVTHWSTGIADLARRPDLFELGLHPNFLPNSSQGNNPDEVLSYCRDMLPHARCVRTHSLFQSERLLQHMANEYGLQIDCSLFVKDGSHLEPHAIKYHPGTAKIVRVPHFFQDNICISSGELPSISDLKYHGPGLKVFDFHPIHIALNSADMVGYDKLRNCGGIAGRSAQDAAAIENAGNGVGTFFCDLAGFLAGKTTFTISEYVDQWLGA